MSDTKIEWTDKTWNPVVGCTRVSAGCDNCYAVVQTRIKAANPGMKGKYVGLINEGKRHFNGVVRLWEPHLDVPLKQTKPSRYFVNSMSDLFHERLAFEDIAKVFDVMKRAHWHVFQVLTKRPERASEFASRLPWPPNVLMGTSVEDDRVLDRIDALRAVPAHVRFLSCEPLIGPLGVVDLTGIQWCIVGGESGPGSRIMRPEWARHLRDQCVAQGVAFHFKQFGHFDEKGASVGKGKSGRLLDGREW
ncbi:MAG TPA: phage Gp37/Gp68 family protein, partial [Rubricoccaceae bacterium]